MPTRRYTEEQFHAAMADPAVRTMADLCRTLGLVPRGANYESLRSYAATLDVDVDQELAWRRLGITDGELRRVTAEVTSVSQALEVLGLPQHGRVRQTIWWRIARLDLPQASALRPSSATRSRGSHFSYTDEELLRVLDDPSIDGYPALCEALGLRPLTETYRRLRLRAAALGAPIPVSWSRTGPRPSSGPRQPAISVADLEQILAAVASSRSLADTIRALGHRPTAAGYAWIKAIIAFHDLDTSHFRPYSRSNHGRARPLDEVLVYGQATQSAHLRRRLIAEGVKEHRCEGCGLAEWNGRPIPLELDHIDGDRLNNLLENLQLVCPNCHAQTPTYRGRNINRRGSNEE